MKSVLNSKPSWLARKMVLSITLAGLTLTSVLAEAQMRGPGRGGGGSSRPEPYNPGRGNDGPGRRGDDRDRGRGEDRGRGRDYGPSQPSRPSEPSRPNRPSEPTRPSQPTRPSEPTRPYNPGNNNGGRGDRDNRPGDNRPGGNFGGRPDRGGYERDHGNSIERRRDEARRDRDNRRDSFNRDRDNRRNERSSWNNRYRVNPSENRRSGYRDHSTWSSRYDRWWSGASRPGYYAPSQRIRWHRPMPSPGAWRYVEVEQIADNLEYLSRDVFDSMDRVALQNEYGLRLRRVLVGLIDATENFNDSVSDRYDWSDTLNDLFYLESQLGLAEQTLDGYSQAWRVQEEMGSLRYYVNELLWTYRQNF